MDQVGEDRGQSAVLVAISLLVLVIFAAITVDISSAYLGRRTAQNAADGAALAAVRQLAYQYNRGVYNDTKIKIELNDFAERNGAGDTDGIPGNAINDSVTGVYLDENEEPIPGGVIGSGVDPAGAVGVQSTVYITTPAFFGGIMGQSGYPVQAQATVALDIACGADCVVPIATHIDTITTTPGCMNIYNGDGPGNFGWLNWSSQGVYCDQNDCSSRCLGANLAPGTCRSGFISFGEWVSGSPGEMNSELVRDALDYFIDTPEEFTVIVWDFTREAGGCNQEYHVVGFARMQLLGYQLAQGGGSAHGDTGEFCTPMGLEPGQDPNDGQRLTANFLGWAGGAGGNCNAIGTQLAPIIKE
jgi:hypothetical protein